MRQRCHCSLACRGWCVTYVVEVLWYEHLISGEAMRERGLGQETGQVAGAAASSAALYSCTTTSRAPHGTDTHEIHLRFEERCIALHAIHIERLVVMAPRGGCAWSLPAKQACTKMPRVPCYMYT